MGLKVSGEGNGKQMYYVVDGDSLTADDSFTGTYNWFNLLVAQLDAAGVVGKNFASSGKKLKEVWETYGVAGSTPSHSVSGGRQFSPSRTGGQGVYMLFAGINDLGGADSAATLYGYIADIVSWAKADGYQRVVVFALTPRTGIDSGAQATRTALNTLILANTAGADLVMDLSAVFADPTSGLYDGGLHFTEAMHARVAVAVRGTLNGLLWGPRIVADVDAMNDIGAEFPGQIVVTADGNSMAFGRTGTKGSARGPVVIVNSGIYFTGAIEFDDHIYRLAGNVLCQGLDPYVAGTDTLGGVGARWGAVYAVAANFSGGVTMGGLPTSDPHVAGVVWRSGNDLKISTG